MMLQQQVGGAGIGFGAAANDDPMKELYGDRAEYNKGNSIPGEPGADLNSNLALLLIQDDQSCLVKAPGRSPGRASCLSFTELEWLGVPTTFRNPKLECLASYLQSNRHLLHAPALIRETL